MFNLQESCRKKNGNFNYTVNKKNATILLAMVFMVSVNIFGFRYLFYIDKLFRIEIPKKYKINLVHIYSNLLNRQPIGNLKSHIPSMPLSNARHGRTLLWAQDYDDDVPPFENQTSTDFGSKCPMFINQTESNRLHSELRRWINGVPDKEKLPKTDLEVKALNEVLKPTPRNSRFLKKRKIRRSKQQVKEVSSTSNINAVQLFTPLLKEHAKLFEALGAKEDTFYVVWFSGDHLLLPASRKNNTSRPKMSLVLPALSVNG